MPAEFECAVCHQPIRDAAATRHLGDIGRMCCICTYLSAFDRAAQARIREFIGMEIMPFGYGRAVFEAEYEAEGKWRGLCVFNATPEIPQEKGPAGKRRA